MAKREFGQMVDIYNKGKTELLGKYTYTKADKADTYVVDCVNKDGQEVVVTKEITKAEIGELSTQAFNTNIRNYIAGLAREKKDTKTAILKEYIQSLGIDTSLPADEIKKQLDEIRQAKA